MNRRRSLTAGVAVLALVLPPGVGQAAAPPVRERTDAVTLITGDRVRLFEQGVAVEPARGREHIGFVRDTRTGPHGTETSVIPTDAVPMLAAGRLDPRLFNVTTLARQGFTDATAPTLPLIVGYHKMSLARSAKPAGVTAKRRELPSINATTMTQDKKRHGDFWHWLTTAPAVDKVWLDGIAQPTLDASVPQIGAPDAWRSGFTGAGVTVGVLDTGIKADHPDLAGKVVESRDFTDTLPSAGDDVGHGTHVAGTIAGNGAASNGKYKGVAPDAKLINGKVCALYGCDESAIIAGMEWIAPKVSAVNMSLGGGATDGTDPLSQAVNRLTAQHGTLFVIAAGNSGTQEKVGTPASADAALAVGSVTKQDGTSEFSSRGPRAHDYAVKPDIGAPGSQIVSTRAKGTEVGDINPVDDNYHRISGTSMATPHVAGAAAILAQQHPDWRADRLKHVLMSTAKVTAGIYDQGAGRVDVSRATAQSVTAGSGSVSFGFVRWGLTEPVRRTVTYRNDGDAAVTLTLDLSVTGPDGKPAGTFAVSASEVTVPAHGTADVEVTAKSATNLGKLHGGRLTATAPGVSVRTAVGAYLEPESYNLSVRVVGRNGTFESAYAQLVNPTTGEVVPGPFNFDANGVAVVRLPKGRWDLNAVDLSTDPANAEQPNTATVMSRTGVDVLRDAAVQLDATAGKPVAAVVDKPDAKRQFGEFGLFSGNGTSNAVLAVVGDSYTQLLAVPSERIITDHPHAFFFNAGLSAAAPGDDPAGYVYNLAFWERGGIPANTAYRVTDRELATVDARYHTQGAPTTYAVRADFARYPVIGAGSGRIEAYAHAVPGRRTEYYTAHRDITWGQLLQTSTTETFDIESHWSFRTYQRGSQRAGWNKAPVGPAFGDAVNGWGVVREGNELKVAASLFSVSDPHGYTSLAEGVTGTTTLTRDGTVLGTSKRAGLGRFAIPDSPGTYTLRATGVRSVPWSVIGASSEATWTFREPGSAAPIAPLPMLVVRADGDVNEQGKARAGQLFPLALTAQSQPGAPAARLASLKVEASYDDGGTWTAVPARFIGNRGAAVLNHPNRDGFVSLRIAARDTAGNTVKQTVIKAYQIARA